MAAVLNLHVYTGADAATESGAVTGIDLISADNAVNSLANRQANPVDAGSTSYEKWLRLKIATAPATAVTNFLFWTDGALDANLTLYAGVTDTGVTPTASASSVATTDATTYVAGNKGTWDAASYSNENDLTDYLVLQLDVGANAAAGPITQETINYSYDET